MVSILEVSGAQFPRLARFCWPVRLRTKYSMTESNHEVLTADVPNSAAQGQAQMEPHSRPGHRDWDCREPCCTKGSQKLLTVWKLAQTNSLNGILHNGRESITMYSPCISTAARSRLGSGAHQAFGTHEWVSLSLLQAPFCFIFFF